MQPDFHTMKNMPGDIALKMLKYAQSAGNFKCDETYVIKRRKYDSILVISTLSGKGYLKYRNKNYEINENQGFVIDCNEPHVYYSDKTDHWHFIWVHFKGGYSNHETQFILNNNGPVFKMKINSGVKNNIFKIIDLINIKGIFCDIQTSGLLNEIMTDLMLNGLPDITKNRMAGELVTKAVHLMEADYKQKMSIDDIASKLFINKFDLIRKFKKYLGITPYDYMLKYRIMQAKILLNTTSDSIGDIANNVGFDDSSHFIKMFKKVEGCTPLKFRGA
ncbi:MAG: AraC family transcriptional regulator [Saccharofermentanales bacterium]